MSVGVNVVVIAGRVAAEPLERTDTKGEVVTELRVSVPTEGQRLLPLPVVLWHKDFPHKKGGVPVVMKDDEVLVHGQLVRRFYRSGSGARSLTEVVASGVRVLEKNEEVA